MTWLGIAIILPGTLVFFPNSFLCMFWCKTECSMQIMKTWLKIKELKSSVMAQCWILKKVTLSYFP